MPAFGPKNRTAAKLTVEQVQLMRRKYREGLCTQGDCCREFNISITQVARILRRESWTHLPDMLTEGELDAKANESMQKFLALQEQGSLAEQLTEAIAEKRKEDMKADQFLEELKTPIPDHIRKKAEEYLK